MTLSSDERDAVIERSGLAWMKANNDKFAPVPMPFVQPTHVPDMVRRGVSGGSDELYTPEQLARVDALALASLARRGQRLPVRRAVLHRKIPRGWPRLNRGSPCYWSSLNTRAAFSRRNFGQTWSLKGTFCMSVKMRSSDRPIGK